MGILKTTYLRDEILKLENRWEKCIYLKFKLVVFSLVGAKLFDSEVMIQECFLMIGSQNSTG